MRVTITAKRVGSFGGDVDGARAGAARAVAIGTLTLEGMVAAAAPVDTGFLKGSVSSRIEGTRGVVTVGAEYGPYVNYGTRRMAAQPFFDNAVEAFRPIYAGIVRREVLG